MGQSLLLRLSKRLSITVLYERGGRQQVAVPAPCSGRIQRWEEIPKATGGKQKKRREGVGVTTRTTIKEKGGKKHNNKNIKRETHKRK